MQVEKIERLFSGVAVRHLKGNFERRGVESLLANLAITHLGADLTPTPTGADETGQPAFADPIEKAVDFIFEKHGGLSLQEIEQSFTLASSGETKFEGESIEMKCWGGKFTVALLSRILGGYDAWRGEMLRKVGIEDKRQLEIACLEETERKNEVVRRQVIDEFLKAEAEFVQGGEPPFFPDWKMAILSNSGVFSIDFLAGSFRHLVGKRVVDEFLATEIILPERLRRWAGFSPEILDLPDIPRWRIRILTGAGVLEKSYDDWIQAKSVATAEQEKDESIDILARATEIYSKILIYNYWKK